MPDHDIKAFVTTEKFKRLDQNRVNLLIDANRTEYVRCHTPDCPGVYVRDGGIILDCLVCNKVWCLDCICAPYHYSMTCQEYKATQKKPKNDIEEASEMIIQMGFRVCPNCKEGVEKSEGCMHMTCKCGFEFCY